MLESVDFQPPQVDTTPKVRYMFILLSFSYMLPWTAMGSLIHYFAMEHGKNYFTILNIAFYGVGLPITYLQKKFDNYYDALHGSKLTYKTRIHVCLSVQIICLVIAPFSGYYGLVLVSMVIGCATWIAHSCTTSLSGMVKFNSSIMQQIGFALPAVFGIITSLAFNLSSNNVPDSTVMWFFFSIALFVFPGVVCWYYMHKSNTVREKLLMKDANLSTLLIESAMKKSEFSIQNMDTLKEVDDLETPLIYGCKRESDVSDVAPRSTAEVSDSDIRFTNAGGRVESNAFVLDPKRASKRILMDARELLNDDTSLIEEVMKNSQCSDILKPYRWTLFITIFGSILQGSFISYTYGCVLFGETELPSVLYFVRIFADLFGRPLGLLQRPKFVSDVHGLLRVSIVRLFCSIYFYTIIVDVMYPETFVDSNACHLILVAFQVVFSASSGYLNSLTYEYASAAFDNEWSRVIAAQQLNLTFQKACTFAVFVAMCVLVFIEIVKPALNIHFPTSRHDD